MEILLLVFLAFVVVSLVGRSAARRRQRALEDEERRYAEMARRGGDEADPAAAFGASPFGMLPFGGPRLGCRPSAYDSTSSLVRRTASRPRI